MKAAVFHELGQPLTIEDAAAPHANRGEIVLKVDYRRICGSDLHATQPGVCTAVLAWLRRVPSRIASRAYRAQSRLLKTPTRAHSSARIVADHLQRL